MLKFLPFLTLLFVPSAYSEAPVSESYASVIEIQDRPILKLDKDLQLAGRGPVVTPQKSATPNVNNEHVLPQKISNNYAAPLPLQMSQTLEKQTNMIINNENDDRQYSPQFKVPLGARISDALTRQDREDAVDILDHERLLLNDKMNLSSLAGRKDEAADIAFILMERSSQDEQLYEQAAPMLLANSRTAGAMTKFFAFETYNSYYSEVFSAGHQAGMLKFDISLHQENRNNSDTALLNSVPDENGGELTLHQNGDSYENIVRFQLSQSLNTQTGISINHLHQIGSRLKLDTQVAYNQTASDNAAMRIIGRSNQLAVESSYTLDGSNQWVVGAGHNQYRTIDGDELGSGNLFSTTLSHELSGVHPALHTRMTGTWSQFQIADQTLSGKSASLIPAGGANTAAYFMPQDVSEIAVYASIGDPTDSQFPARDWEYFWELGVFHNPVTGEGWRSSAGLAGRIIGADRLHMFIRYDQSPNGQGFSSLEAGLAYLLHY